ncbi:MAG: pyrophosphohydrolase including oxidative damage repair enzyme, partial [Phenylobacterium sp.]|nr:pyrophosphohydrolase including oxidative damage repair enzyme [Phenylobacterium sp.]
EAPEDCARREAMEEAGVRLRGLEPLGAAYPCPGVSTERVHLFLGPYAARDRVGKGGGVEGEQEHITVMEVPLKQLWGWVEERRIEDMKTLALVQALRIRRPDLFGG